MKDINKNSELIIALFEIRAYLEKSGDEYIFSKFGISHAFFPILYLISCGVNNAHEMHFKLNESSASITQKLDVLVEKGLVERQINEEDKRRKKILLTPKGLELLEALSPVHNNAADMLLSGVNKSDIEATMRVLKSIQRTLGNN